MKRLDIVNKIVIATGKQPQEVDRILKTALFFIRENVENGKTISFRNFGTFSHKRRAIKLCRNLKTGEKIVVPAHAIATFTPSPRFKKAVEVKIKVSQ